MYKKVLFKKWIKHEYNEIDYFPKLKEGTGCFEKDFVSEGLFHQWAAATIEGSEGFGNYTVALVELPDGTISEVLPVI